MVKNPINFLKKINKAINLYLKNSEFNKKEIKKIGKEVHHLKKETEKLNEKIDLTKKGLEKKNLLIETYLEEVFNHLNIEKKYCPICENFTNIFLPFGEHPRPNALCPKCKSLERHRLIYLYFKNETKIFKNKMSLLHFAPEKILFDIFKNHTNIDYWPVDLYDTRYIKEKVDIQKIPYPSNSFDIVYCSHVLEHVKDDIGAMKELYRVVKPKSEGGSALIMVPLFYDLNETLENEEYNTPELRSKYYGQFDHVRAYGSDFSDKLKSVGFEVEKYNKYDLANDKNLIKIYGITENDKKIMQNELWVCRKNHDQ